MLNVAIGKSPGYFHLVQRHGIEICPLGSWRPPFVLPPGEASNTMSPCQALQRLVRWAHTVLDPAISFTLLYFPEDSASETSLQDYLQGRDVETIRPARHHWWDRVASRLARRKPQPPKVKTSEPSPRREGEEEAESGVENPVENRERIEPSALTEEALRSWGIGMAEPELNDDAGEGKEKGELFRQESRKVEDRCILDTSEVVKERSFSVEPTCDMEVPKTAGDKLSTTERPTVLEPLKQVPERALPPTEDVANTKDPHIAETSSHRKPYREVPKRSKKKVKEPVPVESYNPVTSLLLNMSEPETSRSRKRRQHPELATMDSFRANDMFPSEQRDLSPIEKGTTQEIHPGPIDKHSSPQYQGRDALRSSTHHPHAHQHRHRHHHHHHHHHERRSHHTREQCPTHDHPIQSKEHKGFPARDAERHRDARKHRAHTHNESDSDSLSSAEASDMSSDFSSSASRQSSLSRSLSSLSSDLTASSICSNSLRTKLIAATKKKY